MASHVLAGALAGGLSLAVAMGLLPAPSAAQETASYRLVLDLTWSAQTHPHAFPAEAHFSDLIGVTHDARYVMFGDGLTATSGLELLAENGRTSILEAELAEARRRGRVGATFRAEGLARVPGVISTEIEVDIARRLVSFATMLAPSPDWLAGAAGVDLAPEGRWLDRVELALWAWDAGTDSGTGHDSADADTQPRQSVRLLASPHVLDDAGLRPLGRARIERLR